MSDYYSRENGYVHYILEDDGKTIREARDSNEWREWTCKTLKHYWRKDLNGFRIATWFFGRKDPSGLPPTFWVTTVGPSDCISPHADIVDLHWNTYEEAQAGHDDVVKKIVDNNVHLGSPTESGFWQKITDLLKLLKPI